MPDPIGFYPGGSRYLDGGVQPSAVPSGAVVLWQDAEAYIQGQCAGGQGKDAGSLTWKGLAVCQMKP